MFFLELSLCIVCFCWTMLRVKDNYYLTVKPRCSSAVPPETWLGQDILWPHRSETHSGHGPTGFTTSNVHVIYFILVLYSINV